MNPSNFKSISVKKPYWDLVTSLAEELLPYGKMSRSQVVEIALNRLNHTMFRGEPVDGFTKRQKELNNLAKNKAFEFEKLNRKIPEPAYVGTAITKDEIKSRNRIIFDNRIVANNLTLQQLGTMFNITRERVRQIQENEVSTKKLKQQQEVKHASNN